MVEETPQKYTALITGASNGIGYELARIFAQQGHDLVLVARSEDKLNSMALQFAIEHKVYTKVIARDLAKPDAPQQVFDELKQAGVEVDVLVNNAGIGAHGFFRKADMQKQLDMMQLNMVALTHLTRLFLDQLPPGRHGKILNISSMAAFVPGPLMAVYYASKAYVQSFSEALAAELEEEDVAVTVLCPGPTDTDFKERAGIHQESFMSENFSDDPEEIARAGYKGMMAGEVVVLPGVKYKVMETAVRLMPRDLLRSMIKKVQEKRQ
ncbi:MAG: SDR family oxidoreductase [Hymenobacteraceae bacterium]|nr:SDR family oxidoreductase [Hymenobacteraceae bacterium]